MSKYIPSPVDTSDVKLSSQILELTEILARNTHEVWAKERIKDGWTFGNEINNKLKTHPSLVEYEKLPEEEKDYDRNTALEAIKLLVHLGYRIEK